MAKKPKEATPTATAAPVAPAAPVGETAPVAPVAPVAPAVAAPVAPVEPPKIKDIKNGVTRPAAGTQTGRVWEISDDITAQTGKAAERKTVVEACTALGINASTATTQFGKWAKYHGYIGEKSPSAKPAGATPPAVAAPVAPVAPAAPVNEAPEPFDVGYEAYQAAARGETPSNPYAAGTNEAAAFSNGWAKATEDASNAAAATGTEAQ